MTGSRRLLAALFCACILPASAETLTLDGLDPVKIGMTRKDAEKALGKKLKVEGDANCAMAARPDKKAFYMFVIGRIVRIDVKAKGAGIAWDQGLGISSDEAALKKAFGSRAQFFPNRYVEGGHDVEVSFPAKDRLLLFETDHGKVTSFRVGLPKYVQWVEGCS